MSESPGSNPNSRQSNFPQPNAELPSKLTQRSPLRCVHIKQRERESDIALKVYYYDVIQLLEVWLEFF